MVDLSFEFNDPCTTIPPVEYGGNEARLADFEEMVRSLQESKPLEPLCTIFGM